MKKLLLTLPLLALGGCATFNHADLKSPCTGQYAGLSNNPCNPLPINIAQISTLAQKA